MTQPDVSAVLGANIASATALLQQLPALAPALQRTVEAIADALLNGHKLLCAGNGGSAADSAHFAAEITGRFQLDRPGFPAIDLTANHSLTTALINDFPPAQLFARQVHALATPGDVLVVFSTTGNSENIGMALEAARAQKVTGIALLGRDGGRCKSLADIHLIVPGDNTARIQEAHLLLYHSICQMLDPLLANG